ncbi:hypothetical protein T484DRAFT_1755769, partial [Baffinella frigidus]
MDFPSSADFDDDAVCSSEETRPIAVNVKKICACDRRSSSSGAEVWCPRKLVSEEKLHRTCSNVDSTNIPSQSDSSGSFSRCGSAGSSESWWRESELPEARQLRRHVEVDGSSAPIPLG